MLFIYRTLINLTLLISPLIIILRLFKKKEHPVRFFEKFAISSNIPVTTTLHALGVFDETHKLSLDFLGMHGSVTANYSIQNADLIIALGTRFDDRITGKIEAYAPEAFKAHRENRGGIIHVNINHNEIGNIIDTHYNFKMDCGEFCVK